MVASYVVMPLNSMGIDMLHSSLQSPKGRVDIITAYLHALINPGGCACRLLRPMTGCVQHSEGGGEGGGIAWKEGGMMAGVGEPAAVFVVSCSCAKTVCVAGDGGTPSTWKPTCRVCGGMTDVTLLRRRFGGPTAASVLTRLAAAGSPGI